jgi:hypothetical protein
MKVLFVDGETVDLLSSTFRIVIRLFRICTSSWSVCYKMPDLKLLSGGHVSCALSERTLYLCVPFYRSIRLSKKGVV